MRHYIPVLCLLVALIPSSAGSWGVMGISSGAGSAPASPFPETFSGDLSNWTALNSTGWTISTGTVHGTTADGNGRYWMNHTTAMTYATTVYAKMQITTNYADSRKGIVLRHGSTGGYAYLFTWSSSLGSCPLYILNTADYSIALLDALTATFSSGDWMGVEVTGTGTSTVFNLWRWASDPGDRASWGDPTATSSENPSNAADNGTAVGVCTMNTGDYLDNFTAGSSN